MNGMRKVKSLKSNGMDMDFSFFTFRFSLLISLKFVQNY